VPSSMLLSPTEQF